MIYQYLTHMVSDTFLLVCSVTMLILFFVDIFGLARTYFRYPNARHLDFKTTIVSIGLFATFFGVLIGLYGFDPVDITKSVPRLLEGLRFAFGASVLGMFLSLTLSIFHRFLGASEEDDSVLQSIDRKMGALVTTVESPAEFVRQFTDMKSFLKDHLEKINTSLDKALVQLAKGATEEVTRALQKIITEFNDNLTSQFGENFKELNAACHRMVEWQDKYKNHIDVTEKSLAQVLTSLEDSCEAAQELAAKNEETQKVCKDVGTLIGTYDLQVQTLAKYLEKCKTLGDQAGEFLNTTQKAILLSSENLNSFAGTIETSVSKQSESLAQLTEDIDARLPKALGELEKVLTNITNQFAADYRSLFQFITDKR